MKKIRSALLALAAILTVSGAWAGYSAYQTRQHLDELHQQAVGLATRQGPVVQSGGELPEPVQRYFHFTLKDQKNYARYLELKMKGRFRRPLTSEFTPSTARQTLVSAVPALVFESSVPIVSAITATAYDAYLDGEMEMGAKLMSAFSILEVQGDPVLNQISLRRWLLEASSFPPALLPGKHVQWQAIDDLHARAIVKYQGVSASLIATFADDGRLLSFHAENDGDLTTPYHGSGEYVSRSDYRLTDGMMLPYKFTIARMADGKKYPFWDGEIIDYQLRY